MSQPQKRIEELQSKNPTELLREQVLLLHEIREALAEIKESQSNVRPNQSEVKVTDLQMPIWSMMVFILLRSLLTGQPGVETLFGFWLLARSTTLPL